MTVLQIKSLNYVYNDTQVLKNINLSIQKGEFVSIVGTSGVGKTTLFHLIANILPLQSGQIICDNMNNTNVPVSYMFQKDLLLPHKTVIENVMLPLQIQKENKKIAREKARQLLKEFHLDHVQHDYPSALSGGMKQRVALLRTYMMGHSLCLLDEPFSALDAMTKLDIQQWYIKAHYKLKLTTLLITHDIEEAIALSHRVYVLAGKPGEIIQEVAINIDDTKDVDVQKLMYKKDILNCLKHV